MGYLFTSESVSEGHPDKVADQISDALLDEFLRLDPNSRVACETLVTTGLVVCAGEVRTNGYVEVQEVVRDTIAKIGYTKAEYRFDSLSCGILNSIHDQSGDINQGVDRANPEEMGAGDQGLMFGYACTEMENLMPLPIELAHRLVQVLAEIRKEGKEMTYLRPDSKSQVTVEYNDEGKAQRIDTIVVSTQHDGFWNGKEVTPELIALDIQKILLPRVIKDLKEETRNLFKNDIKLLVNPTGKFEIGGPHGDTGLTGRKIIVDTYGGRAAHGGGAFSGKDSSKVDRSAAYAARYLAKNLVAAGVCTEAQVQVAYAIGVAQPVNIYVNTYGTAKVKDNNGKTLSDAEIGEKVLSLVDLRPYSIINRLGLRFPVFAPTASYGHFGRTPYEQEVELYYEPKDLPSRFIEERKNRKVYAAKVTFFAWEKTDLVEDLKKLFTV